MGTHALQSGAIDPFKGVHVTAAPPRNVDFEASTCDLRRIVNFASLPPEIHLAISQNLIYPDALALKHVNRYFYSIVDTDIELKIDWLMERRRLHLECPNDKRCDLGSDLRFCRGSVPLLMRRRRDHVECEGRPNLGCIVYDTPTCPQRRKNWTSRWRRRLQSKLTIELWWLLIALIPVVLSVMWMLLARSSSLPHSSE